MEEFKNKKTILWKLKKRSINLAWNKTEGEEEKQTKWISKILHIFIVFTSFHMMHPPSTVVPPPLPTGSPLEASRTQPLHPRGSPLWVPRSELTFSCQQFVPVQSFLSLLLTLLSIWKCYFLFWFSSLFTYL